MNKYAEISEAIKRGKAPVDVEVENAMHKSAVGYFVTVREPMRLRKEKIEKDGSRTITEYIEYAERQIYIKPEVTAQIFWLKNRKPEQWRDKREQVVSTKDGMLSELIDGLKQPAETDA